jgi:glycosyltransferase involved in cell wall biosynthesis
MNQGEMSSEITRQSWDVPTYDIKEFGPKRHRYCVTIFVINEGKNIQAQLAKMRPLSDMVDIIIADGGSTDGSLADEVLMTNRVRALLIKTGLGKLSAQMRVAIAYTLQEGYDGVIPMDGNNKDDPSAIPRFIEALDAGFDHIQGSRFIVGGSGINTPTSRLLGIKLVHAPLISLAAGFRYTDTTNGFRAYSCRFLLDPRVAPLRSIFSTYELHYYLAIRASRLGYSVTEIPVTRAYPAKGPTPTKISGLQGNILILKTLIRACCNQFDPPLSYDKEEK